MPVPIPIDCVVFGGGVAGLWILDAALRSGRSALLLEASELGAGQTVCAQGIIHGGFKYTLRGLLTPAARAVAQMPTAWRECLAGTREPVLRATRVRAPCCHLWQTASLGSAIGMLGARAGLRVTPALLDRTERPPALRDCPGSVARIDEQVIDPASLLHELSTRWRRRILRYDQLHGLELRLEGPGSVRCISLIHPESGELLELAPACVVFAAGAGNEALRAAAGLPAGAGQLRPLHMVLVRGDLPVLNGHCIDGARTRVTVTSAEDSQRPVVWQVGGQLAEDGVALDGFELAARAAEELAEVLPGVDLEAAEWSTYRVDRAERRSAGAARPDDAQLVREPGGNVLTAWPTKMALAPRLAELALAAMPAARAASASDPAAVEAAVAHWPRPLVALPPWETAPRWWRTS